MELQARTYVEAMKIAGGTLAQTLAQLPHEEGVEDGIRPGGVVPAEIVRFLAQLRLLQGVPFTYLIADANLIPAESIRFFYLDRNATDALVEGALSVGTVNAADRAQLAELYQNVRDEVDAAERLVRVKDSDAPALDAQGRPIGIGGQISGFVLRSRLVSGWPGLHVRAYATDTHNDNTSPDLDTSPDRVRLLRMERLAPAVLLVLFDGVPALVHLEEPRSGIQFGVRLDQGAAPAQQTAAVTVRDVLAPNNGPLKSGGQDVTVTVPFRSGSPGVVNMKKLNEDLLNVTAANMGPKIDSAEYAMQMLRFPLRQVFGDTTVPVNADAFMATIKIAALTERFQLAARVLGK